MKRLDDRSFLVAGGEMAERIRAFDWSSTPLGPFETWSPALRTTVGVLLANRFPLLLWWGPQYISIYNDAYVPILGRKHPDALGQPVSQCWSEIWHILKPLIDTPFNGGPSTWIEDFELYLQRLGFTEEAHFTVAYSPIPDETAPGRIGGVLATVHEITQKVIGERRVEILRDLGLQAAESTAEEACRMAAAILARHGRDVPFALLYLIEPDGRHARLAGSTGLNAGEAASPPVVSLDEDAEPERSWPLATAFRSRAMVTVTDLAGRFDAVPAGPWADPPHSAVIVPVRSSKAHELAALLVAGVSARLAFDDLYRGFHELLAGQIATAIAEARAYEEERKRAEALAELDRAKTVFFSNVSHEFRTPLTLMLGPLEELRSEIGRSTGSMSAPQSQQIDLIHRNALRLLKLTNALLEFSRIEAGRVQASYQPTDLAALTVELASVFRSAVEKAGLKLIVDCPALPEPAFVDRDMWEKVVLNLISNALKFTFEGEIEVRLRHVDGRFELAVRDTGTGIPADEVPRLFERFHRVIGARGRTHEGSGIGLALVQELVRLHGGSVSAESVHGAGSTFRVSIPEGHAHLPQQQTGSARTQSSTALGAQPFVQEVLRWLPDVSEAEQLVQDMPIAQAPAAPGEARARILLADDNADMRDYLRRLLGARYRVQAVADGEAALSAVRQGAFDLVLADIMMPRLDGLGLLAHLRAEPDTRTLPVILLSARAGEEAKVEGLQAGADDYLIKPFSARELLACVEANLSLKQLREQSEQALRESEERFRNMADHAPVMVRVTEPDGRCSYLGKSWYEFTGQAPQSGLGFGWLDATHPDDRAAAHDAFMAANADRTALRLEYRLRRADGEYRWVIDSAAPRFGRNGEFIGYIGSVIDITERKQVERTQQLLLNELNHRVKNTLASVQAIAQQTLRTTKDPSDFAARFSGRIQSLARVHSLLTDTSWQGADLRELILDQLLQGPVDETRVTAWGPAIRLAPQMALHLALTLHELGTNSAKYGALSTTTGWVTVSWSVRDRVLQLRWVERGGPTVNAPFSRGFGTTLVEQSAIVEGGRAQMVCEAEGITWDIALPLPASETLDLAVRAEPEMIQPAPRTPAQAGPARPAAVLEGWRFLVIEDEPLIALDLAATLEMAGAQVSPPVGTAREALQLIEQGGFDGALLDANLHGRPVDAIAAALTRRNIPFVFVTGYGRAGLPGAFREAAVLTKPVGREQLLEAIVRLKPGGNNVTRLKP